MALETPRYVTHLLNGRVYLSDQMASCGYASEQALASLVTDLIERDYAFVDEPAGWPPAAIVQELKDRGLVTRPFTAITWRGPDQYELSLRP